MDFQSEFSWLELEELHAPTQSFAAVVGQRYCFPNSAQYRLENEILSKSWIITEANGEVVFRVRGKKGGLVQVQAGAGGRKWKSCCVYGRKAMDNKECLESVLTW